MIEFILMVNKFGQTRIAQYFQTIEKEERKTLESELVRKCLSRNPEKSFMFQHLNYKVIYRRYASLYFIFGVSKDEENEMGFYILIHRFVQILDSYFGNVCELDIMMNLDKVYYILEEMIQNGDLIDGSEKAILGPLKVLDNCQLIFSQFFYLKFFSFFCQFFKKNYKLIIYIKYLITKLNKKIELNQNYLQVIKCQQNIMMNRNRYMDTQNHLLSNIFYSEQDNVNDQNNSFQNFTQQKKFTNPNLKKPQNLFYENSTLQNDSSNFIPIISKSRPASKDVSYLDRARKRSQRKTHKASSKYKRAVSQMDYYEIEKKILQEQQNQKTQNQIYKNNALSESRIEIFQNNEIKENSYRQNLNESKVIDIYKSLSIEPKRNDSNRSQQRQYRNESMYKKPMKQRERSAKLKKSKINPTKYENIQNLENKYQKNLQTLKKLKTQYKKSNKQPQKHRILLTQVKQLEKQIEQTQISTVLSIGDKKELKKQIQNLQNQKTDLEIQIDQLNHIERTKDKKDLIDKYLEQQQIKQKQKEKIQDNNWLEIQKEKLLKESEKYKTQQLKEIEITISLQTPELIKWMKYLINKKQLNFLIIK